MRRQSGIFTFCFFTIHYYLTGAFANFWKLRKERDIMSDSGLLVKSKTINASHEIKSGRRETVLTNQIIRSGTSIGADNRCIEVKKLLISSVNTAKQNLNS
jgi:hypothetical protein